MSANALFLTIEEEQIVPILQQASVSIDGAQGDAVLDFSSVHRINSDALRALEDFARVAEEKAVNVVFRGVNVDIYKVLKLVKLTHRVSCRQ